GRLGRFPGSDLDGGLRDLFVRLPSGRGRLPIGYFGLTTGRRLSRRFLGFLGIRRSHRQGFPLLGHAERRLALGVRTLQPFADVFLIDLGALLTDRAGYRDTHVWEPLYGVMEVQCSGRGPGSRHNIVWLFG